MTEATLSKGEFLELLSRATAVAVSNAQSMVAEHLPALVRYQLEVAGLNSSEASLDCILQHLLIDGRHPRVIDVSVVGATKDSTIVWLRPAGLPFTDKREQRSIDYSDLLPFKCGGLLLASHFWNRRQPFSLEDLAEAAPAWAAHKR